jgi:hypothetical protein
MSQPPRSRATAVQAARNSSARARSTMVLATTMPPMAKAAMLCGWYGEVCHSGLSSPPRRLL